MIDGLSIEQAEPERRATRRGSIRVIATALLTGCATACYVAMEKAGVHKRVNLVDRVKDARDAQEPSAFSLAVELRLLLADGTPNKDAEPIEETCEDHEKLQKHIVQRKNVHMGLGVSDPRGSRDAGGAGRCRCVVRRA